MNYSYEMYNLWLRYVENLSAETLLECYSHSVKSTYDVEPDESADISTGHRRFSIWSKGTVYTFRGPKWSRMLPSHEDSQLSHHISPTVLEDFERLVIL